MCLFKIHNVKINVAVDARNAASVAHLPDIEISGVGGVIVVLSKPDRVFGGRRLPDTVEIIFATIEERLEAGDGNFIEVSGGSLIDSMKAHADLIEITPIFPVKSDAEFGRIISDLVDDPAGLRSGFVDTVGVGIEIDADG